MTEEQVNVIIGLLTCITLTFGITAIWLMTRSWPRAHPRAKPDVEVGMNGKVFVNYGTNLGKPPQEPADERVDG